MKKLLLFLAIGFLNLVQVHAQDPSIEWQNTIGGGLNDQITSIQQTADGGYILGGYSNSDISGDKTEDSRGSWDYWVVKVNSSGLVEWDKTIGGSLEDKLHSIQQTSDGGYILAGDSFSDISGDKTENSNGAQDYWVVKLDASGNIQWQNTIGGNSTDHLNSIEQTTDGGYILGGWSSSGANGDKTEPATNAPASDYWVVKIDVSGTINWQNTIGGNSFDRLQSIQQTTDGGYILGGDSHSAMGTGDKTEPRIGENDYWLIKLNATGVIVWQNVIGGTDFDNLMSIQQTNDNGYILGGYSSSGISGDKTEPSQGGWDYWVVKVNESGTVIWENTIGGDNNDQLHSLEQTNDGGYILGGFSFSDISGDKTDGSNGGADFWILKLDTNGIITEQNAIGGFGEDRLYSLQEVPGGLILGGYSESDISGDKTEDSNGAFDYWIVKLDASILGINNAEFESNLLVYPNPTQGNVTIELGESYVETTITVHNILGQKIINKSFENRSSLDFNIEGAAGIYLVNINTSEGKSATLKVVKQ